MLAEAKVSIIDRCYVCHNTHMRSVRDREGFTHLICDNCHLMQLQPQHFVSSTHLYTDAYFNGRMLQETGGKMGYAESYSDPTKSHRTQEYSHYVNEIMHWAHDNRRKLLKVLDFGCGYGGFLKTLQERMGDGIEIHGIEVDSEVCAKASAQLDGALVYCVDLKIDTGMVPRDYFDVITMLDVIEHLDDPRLYLQRLAECANDTAFLLLSTPNIESLNARLYGDNWVLHGAPGHMYYFGPRSIRIILQQSGWKLVKLYTERTIFHNERHGMETWRGKLVRLLFQNRFWDMLTNRLLRIGSIMTVVAQRDLRDSAGSCCAARQDV